MLQFKGLFIDASLHFTSFFSTNKYHALFWVYLMLSRRLSRLSDHLTIMTNLCLVLIVLLLRLRLLSWRLCHLGLTIFNVLNHLQKLR
jgi:hypothetical protein